jgi:hypothetical protein
MLFSSLYSRKCGTAREFLYDKKVMIFEGKSSEKASP